MVGIKATATSLMLADLVGDFALKFEGVAELNVQETYGQQKYFSN